MEETDSGSRRYVDGGRDARSKNTPRQVVLFTVEFYVPSFAVLCYGYEDCRGHPGAPPMRYYAHSTLSGSTMGRYVCWYTTLCHSAVSRSEGCRVEDIVYSVYSPLRNLGF